MILFTVPKPLGELSHEKSVLRNRFYPPLYTTGNDCLESSYNVLLNLTLADCAMSR